MDLFWNIVLVATIVSVILFMAFAATFAGIAFRDQNEKKDGATE